MTIETLDYADPISTPGGGPTSGITGAEPGLATVSVTSNEPQRVLLLGAGMVTAPTVDFLAVDRGSVGTRCKGEGKVVHVKFHNHILFNFIILSNYF